MAIMAAIVADHSIVLLESTLDRQCHTANLTSQIFIKIEIFFPADVFESAEKVALL